MTKFGLILNWISSLKVAISLLFIIAIASALGTAIPQGEPQETYLNLFASKPWFGFLDGETLLLLQLNHICKLEE